MARIKRVFCKECKTEYEIPLSANFMYFCSNCKQYIGCECEYGFAAIAPCEIYLGEELIGRINGGRCEYSLDCGKLGINIKLTKEYRNLAVYHEAVDIIKEKLEKDGDSIWETDGK